MSKIVYFIVGVDLDLKEKFIDDDEYSLRYRKHEQVWNQETYEWEEYDEDTYQVALGILNDQSGELR